MPKYQKKLFSSFFIILFFVFLTASQSILTAHAGSFLNGLNKTAENAGYTDTSSLGKKSPEQIIAIIINAVLGLIGVLLLFLLIYGGFVWMKARGNDAETKRAQDIIRNAIIGMILVLTAYIITFYVYSKLYSFKPSSGFERH